MAVMSIVFYSVGQLKWTLYITGNRYLAATDFIVVLSYTACGNVVFRIEESLEMFICSRVHSLVLETPENNKNTVNDVISEAQSEIG